MKNIIKRNSWLLAITASAMLFISIWMAAETNFANAIDAAVACDGSDSEIEGIMSTYGFQITSWSSMEPTTIEKLTALFIK